MCHNHDKFSFDLERMDKMLDTKFVAVPHFDNDNDLINWIDNDMSDTLCCDDIVTILYSQDSNDILNFLKRYCLVDVAYGDRLIDSHTSLELSEKLSDAFYDNIEYVDMELNDDYPTYVIIETNHFIFRSCYISMNSEWEWELWMV